MPSESLSGEDANRRIETLTTQLDRERRARRHRMEIGQLAARTSGEVSRRGVAEVIAAGASAIFDAGWVMVGFVGDDDTIHLVHGPHVPTVIADVWQTAPLEVAVPVADVLRGDTERIALTSRADFDSWPIMVAEADRAEMSSLFVEAVPGTDRPHAVVVLAWREAHQLDSDEQDLLTELVEVATPAFQRAVRTEADHDLVVTLQKWLLPHDLVDIDGLDVATMYEAGRTTMEVGGDWYDIVGLDDHRSAIVIGDVVGHDVRAIAEMAQVRSVLAAHLLVTGDPSTSLELTDQYFRRQSPNTMATALVMLFDGRTSTVEFASAGHLPPVLAHVGEPSHVIAAGLGPPIGSGMGGYCSSFETLPPGAMVIAVTDGVVELRDETIDTSMSTLCRTLDGHLEADAEADVESVVHMLRAHVRHSDGSDDAAAVVFRLH